MFTENPTLFISYARRESEFALRLGKDLRSAGVNIWIDQLDLTTGQRWDRFTEKALKTCNLFLIILSPASVASENVMDEIGFALEKNRQIFPILYQNCEVPLRIRRIQYSDFTSNYEKGLQQLLHAVNAESPKKSSSKIMTQVGAKKRKPKRATVVTAALTVVAILATIFTMNLLQKEPVTPVPARHRQVTFGGNVEMATGGGIWDVAPISPNGQFLAYVVPKDSLYSVMVQDLSGGQPLEISSGFESVKTVSWSRKGSELLCAGYMPNDKNGQVYIFPRLGGTPKVLPMISGARLSPDGSQIASIRQTWQDIRFFNAATGDSLGLLPLSGFEWLRDLDWSPSGERLVFLASDVQGTQYTIWTVKTDGTQQRKIVEEPGDFYSPTFYSPRWSNDGSAIYYLRGNGQTRDLMKIKVSSVDGTPSDEPEILQTGLNAFGFTLTNDNKKLSYTKYLSFDNLWLFMMEGDGAPEELVSQKLTHGTSSFSWPNISPDGENVVFSYRGEIFTMPTEGGEMQQVTFLNSNSFAPCWSPDGKELAFVSDGKVWSVTATGGPPRQFEKTETGQGHLSWSPGMDILYQRVDNRNFHFLKPETEKERPLLANDSFGWIFDPRYSPDGDNVAVWWNRKDKRGLWLISVEARFEKLLQRGRFEVIQWSGDGKWIYALDMNESPIRIQMIPVHGGKARTFVALPLANTRHITMTSNGKRIICSVEETISDVWLLENFDPELGY